MSVNGNLGQNQGVPRTRITTWTPERLRREREARGWTIEELAVHVDLSVATVRSYLEGKNAPSPAALKRLADALDIYTTDLIPLSDEPHLHELRWHSGLTVEQLARAVSMSTGRTGAVLRGASPLPSDLTQWVAALGRSDEEIRRAWAKARRDIRDRA